MENYSIHELSLNDGTDIYQMLKEIGPGENGFQNRAYDKTEAEFKNWLQSQINMSKGIDLDPKLVPMTTYWLRHKGYPVGTSKLRCRLSEALLINGGHIGFCIRPSERGKGYSSILLKETLKKAFLIGIESALLTCDIGNDPSWKTIEKCGGIIEKIENGRRYYWIKTKDTLLE